MNKNLFCLFRIFNRQSAIILLIFFLFIASGVLSFFAFKNGQTRGLQAGWNYIIGNKGLTKGSYVFANHLIYRLEGKIVEIKPSSIVLQSPEGKIKEFSTKFSAFTVLSDQFANPVEAKTKKISLISTPENFAIGDKVIILAKSNQLSGKILVTKVMKIVSN